MADFIAGIMNLIIEALGSLLGLVCQWLPDSPFEIIDNSILAEYFPSLNWFFPFSEIIVVSEAWLACILVYYAYQTVLRWIKAVQ